jgi:hypothetical protein
VAVPGKAASSKDARRALAIALAAQKALDEGKSVSI